MDLFKKLWAGSNKKLDLHNPNNLNNNQPINVAISNPGITANSSMYLLAQQPTSTFNTAEIIPMSIWNTNYTNPYGCNNGIELNDGIESPAIHLVVLFIKKRLDLNLLKDCVYNDIVFCMDDNSYHRCSRSNQYIGIDKVPTTSLDIPQWVEIVLTDDGYEDKIIVSDPVVINNKQQEELFEAFEKNIMIPIKNLIEEKQNYITKQDLNFKQNLKDRLHTKKESFRPAYT